MKQRSVRKAKREREELSHIADPIEADWRLVCQCDGAKVVDTFECFMRSNGGCGKLHICPKGCGGALFFTNPSTGVAGGGDARIIKTASASYIRITLV